MTLYVGPDKAVFQVHEKLLFDVSPVFKAAFSGGFKEASERSMQLPDDDKGSVGRLIQWLYYSKIDLTTPVCDKTSDECYMQLASLNTLAEKYGIYQLKNHIIDELFDIYNSPRYIRPPQLSVVAHVYNNTTPASALRKLLVAWNVYDIKLDWYNLESTKNGLAGAPHDFVVDLAMKLGARLNHRDGRNPLTLPSSDFHEKPSKKDDQGRNWVFGR